MLPRSLGLPVGHLSSVAVPCVIEVSINVLSKWYIEFLSVLFNLPCLYLQTPANQIQLSGW